jgi:hypothetical protein
LLRTLAQDRGFGNLIFLTRGGATVFYLLRFLDLQQGVLEEQRAGWRKGDRRGFISARCRAHEGVWVNSRSGHLQHTHKSEDPTGSILVGLVDDV